MNILQLYHSVTDFMILLKVKKNEVGAKFSNISITNSYIIIENEILLIENISKITSHKITISFVVKYLFGLSSYLAWMASDSFSSQGTAILLTIIFIFVLLFKKYGIQIITNAGTINTIIVKKEVDASTLIELLTFAIAYRDKLPSMSITNIDSSIQLVKGDMIMGDKFSKIKDSLIVNRSRVNVGNTDGR